MVIIRVTAAITAWWVLMQSFCLSPGFYTVLVKLVTEDLALILCLFFSSLARLLPLLLLPVFDDLSDSSLL